MRSAASRPVWRRSPNPPWRTDRKVSPLPHPKTARSGGRDRPRSPDFRSGAELLSYRKLVSIHCVIRGVLKLMTLYGRSMRNAERLTVRNNEVLSKRLPAQFDDLALLHLSDMRIDRRPPSSLASRFLRSRRGTSRRSSPSSSSRSKAYSIASVTVPRRCSASKMATPWVE
jgi:hypothetical protein